MVYTSLVRTPLTCCCFALPSHQRSSQHPPPSRLSPDSPDSSGLASRHTAKQSRTPVTAGRSSPAIAQPPCPSRQPVPAGAPAVGGARGGDTARGQWLASLPCPSPEAGWAHVHPLLACCPGSEATLNSWVTLSAGTLPPGHPPTAVPCLGIPLLAEKLATPSLLPLFPLGRGTGLGKVSKVLPAFSQTR